MNDAEYIAAIAGNYKNRQGPELQAHYERLMRISAALAAAPAQSGVRQFTDDERQFTKKPVTIQAIQWTGRNLREVIAFTDGPPDTRSAHAGMAWDAYVDLVARDGLKIYTLEGKMSAAVGDWIIKGVQGEHYPCKPDIFEATYSRAALAAPAQQPWQYTPPAQERIDALELEVRQLTEQIAELRHAPTPQADSQPAPLREGEWINDAGRIKWLMWRVQDLEAKLAARAPADSVLEDAARYRVLRDQNNPLENYDYVRWQLNGTSCYHIVDGVRELKSGEELDTATDAVRAAMAAKKGDTHE